MLVGFVQFGTYPFPKVRRRSAQVDCHVEYAPLHDADELALSLLYLVVQAAQNAFGGFQWLSWTNSQSTPMVERKSRSL